MNFLDNFDQPSFSSIWQTTAATLNTVTDSVTFSSGALVTYPGTISHNEWNALDLTLQFSLNSDYNNAYIYITTNVASNGAGVRLQLNRGGSVSSGIIGLAQAASTGTSFSSFGSINTVNLRNAVNTVRLTRSAAGTWNVYLEGNPVIVNAQENAAITAISDMNTGVHFTTNTSLTLYSIQSIGEILPGILSVTDINLDGTFTINVDGNVDLSAATSVTSSLGGVVLGEAISKTVNSATFNSPTLGLALNATYDLIITADGDSSNPSSQTLLPPVGYSSVVLTGIDVDSWLNDPNYTGNVGGDINNIGVNDIIVYQNTTNEAGSDVTIGTTGIPEMPNADTDGITVDQTISWFYLEAQEGYTRGPTATLTLLVPVNEAPVANDDTFNILSTATNGTVVGTYTATDSDGTVISYSIDNAALTIDNSGVITLVDNTGITVGVNITATVTATDNEGATDTALITITVSSPGISITDVTAGVIRPGTTVTLTHTYASPTGKTLSALGSNVPVTFQDGDFTTFSAMDLLTFGDRTGVFDSPLTVTITEGSNTDSTNIVISPPIGQEVGVISALSGIWASEPFTTAGLAIGDRYYAPVTPGADWATGSVPVLSTEQNITVYTQDITDGTWSATPYNIVIPALEIVLSFTGLTVTDNLGTLSVSLVNINSIVPANISGLVLRLYNTAQDMQENTNIVEQIADVALVSGSITVNPLVAAKGNYYMRLYNPLDYSFHAFGQVAIV